MPSNRLILCRPLLLLPSVFPSIRIFSNESALHIRWPKYWSFSFNISPTNEHPGLISFRMDWLGLLAVQGTLKSLLQHHSSKASVLQHSAFFIVQLSHPNMTTGKTIALTRRTFIDNLNTNILQSHWLPLGMQEVGLGIGDISLVLKSQNMEVGKSKKQWPNNDDKGMEPYLEVEQTGQQASSGPASIPAGKKRTTRSGERHGRLHTLAADCFTALTIRATWYMRGVLLRSWGPQGETWRVFRFSNLPNDTQVIQTHEAGRDQAAFAPLSGTASHVQRTNRLPGSIPSTSCPASRGVNMWPTKPPSFGWRLVFQGGTPVSSYVPLLFLVVRGSRKTIMKTKNKTNTGVSTFLGDVEGIF